MDLVIKYKFEFINGSKKLIITKILVSKNFQLVKGNLPDHGCAPFEVLKRDLVSMSV
jgi:hypothetical protein